jgi:hypothetical protein
MTAAGLLTTGSRCPRWHEGAKSARLKRVEKASFDFEMPISMFLHLIRLSRALPVCAIESPVHRLDANDSQDLGGVGYATNPVFS